MKPLAFAADAASLWRLYGFEVCWEGVEWGRSHPYAPWRRQKGTVGAVCSEGQRGQGGLGNGNFGAQAHFGCACQSMPGVRGV